MKRHFNAVRTVAIMAILAIGLCLSSCEDTPVAIQSAIEPTSSPEISEDEELPRIAIGSRSELKELIAQLEKNDVPSSRAVLMSTYQPNQFESLLDANIRKIKESLTKEELEQIEKEDLDICPSDSIIADIQFTMLLNANREIQVSDTVYRYFKNGVAFARIEHADELRGIASSVENITVTENNAGKMVAITPNAGFIPIFNQYAEHVDIYQDGGGSSPGSVPPPFSHSGWKLNNGTFIYDTDTRVVDYNDRGDGNWFQFTIGKFFGRDIAAIKYFPDGMKLLLKFYDQNYIIYTKIGTTLKLQKQIGVIWCDAKATEMEHGWESVTVKYTIPKPIPPETFSHPDFKNPSISTYRPFPFTNENRLVLHIPFISYDFTTRDLNSIFRSACTTAFNSASSWVKEQCGNANNMDLMCFDKKEVYFIHGPYSKNEYNTKGMSTNFYSKWFPGVFSITFSAGSTFSVKNVNISTNDGVELYRGCVYGAVKHNGLWKAAKIYKYE